MRAVPSATVLNKTSSNDTSSQEILSRYRRALAPYLADSTLFEFSFGALDRLNLPLWTTALIAADGALSDGYGYGADETLAQISAWGETLEWFYARKHLKQAARRHASFAELRREGASAINPVSLNLSAGSRYTYQQRLTWVQACRYPSGEPVLVPVEFVAPRYADIAAGAHETFDSARCLAVPITNGLGAGITLEHAIAQGALELLQRDGNSVNYRALDQGIGIELDDVRDPRTLRLLAHLDEQGIEIAVKLATTDFGITNLYVVGYDRDPAHAPHHITLSACGEAAHPDCEQALGKALREFTSSRARKHFMHGSLDAIRRAAPADYLAAFRPAALRDEDDRAFREMREWLKMPRGEFLELLRERVLRVERKVRFSELPTTAGAGFNDAPALLDLLSMRFGKEGYEILYVEFADERAKNEAGTHVVKTIIPGFEVETMTYERIGRRNLRRLLERNSPLVGFYDHHAALPADAKPIRLTNADEQRSGGAAWFSSSAREREIGNLYALYREPGRHVVAFAEEINMQTPARSAG